VKPPWGLGVNKFERCDTRAPIRLLRHTLHGLNNTVALHHCAQTQLGQAYWWAGEERERRKLRVECRAWAGAEVALFASSVTDQDRSGTATLLACACRWHGAWLGLHSLRLGNERVALSIDCGGAWRGLCAFLALDVTSG